MNATDWLTNQSSTLLPVVYFDLLNLFIKKTKNFYIIGVLGTRKHRKIILNWAKVLNSKS